MAVDKRPASTSTVAPPSSSSSQRDSIRTKILGSAKVKRIQTTFFGAEVEVKQPTLREVLDKSDEEGRTTLDRSLDLMIQNTFVPGTDERVFEEGDRPMLADLPMTREWTEMQTQITQLMGIVPTEADDKKLSPLEKASSG